MNMIFTSGDVEQMCEDSRQIRFLGAGLKQEYFYRQAGDLGVKIGEYNSVSDRNSELMKQIDRNSFSLQFRKSDSPEQGEEVGLIVDFAPSVPRSIARLAIGRSRMYIVDALTRFAELEVDEPKSDYEGFNSLTGFVNGKFLKMQIRQQELSDYVTKLNVIVCQAD